MNALNEEVGAEQVLTDILDAPPPPCAATLGDNLSDFASRERPTAAMLVAGIAIAARAASLLGMAGLPIALSNPSNSLTGAG
jgi:hypothetical protein